MIELLRTVKTDIVMIPQKRKINLYKCCECGNEFERAEFSVKNMQTAHCGCRFDYATNWKYGKQLKRRWVGINSRTINGNHPYPYKLVGPYANVSICQEWKDSFKAFYTWSIDNGFKPHLHIDRIDPKKGYEPSNCRWVTQQENNRNGARSKLDTTRVRELLLLHGVYTNLDISRVYDIDPSTLVNICKGVIWNDVYKLYATEKNSKRLNPKFLLPIRKELIPGTIDFSNRELVNRIQRGYLALDKDANYEMIDTEPNYYLYCQYDKSGDRMAHYFDLILSYIKDEKIFISRLYSIFKNDKEVISPITDIIKELVTDDIKSRFIMRMDVGGRLLVKSMLVLKR